uniref:Endoplasmic oxidoreductin-1 n=1 Tax=Rhabditophanes sp. KR3021 TaxID=114890 RepID=A0AC35TQF9_9BILA
MEKECPFWADERSCGSKECGIENCDDEVPEQLKKPMTVHIPSSQENSLEDDKVEESEKCEEKSNSFDPLDRSLSEVDKAQIAEIETFDETKLTFCDMHDEEGEDLHYVNLFKNPERYTGYSGNSAQKVWMTIYQENCFKPDPKIDPNYLLNPSNVGMCLEKRVFYRLISGLHSAITISIASHNFKPAPMGFGQGTWFRNVEMFKGRFGTKWSWEGPERMKNIYFVYLLEMKALLKIAPYLNDDLFYTGNEVDDKAMKDMLGELVGAIEGSPNSFDEKDMFNGPFAPSLREEFRMHFHNISRIMDCVACDKCRLWGKLQTHGMGTALKILFSEMPVKNENALDNGTIKDPSILLDDPHASKVKALPKYRMPYWLTRNDIVALFQSFGRYASSIREIEEFRKELAVKKTEL